MTSKDLCVLLNGRLCVSGGDTEITGFFAGDFLSYVMGNAKSGCAWLTVMNNVNVAGVAFLIEVNTIVICAGIEPDETMLARCDERGISVISTPLDIFGACLAISKTL